MSDREQHGLKGPVRSLSLLAPCGSQDTWLFDQTGRVIERSHRHSDRRQWTTEYRYDELGNLVEPRPRKEVRQHDDGRRTEVEPLRASDNLMWGNVPGLPPVGFPTRGASKVETSYDSRGWPVGAVFFDPSGNITTRVAFQTDERGKVVEAAQYSGAKPALRLSWIRRLLLPRSDRQRHLALIHAGSLESRVSFRYDDLGHLVEMTSYWGQDEVIERVAYTYNEHGDRLTESLDGPESGTSRAESEYDYDSHGNWTCQRVRSGGGVHEMRRTIRYYDE